MSHIVTKEELIKANGGNTISNTLVRSENKKIVVLTNIIKGEEKMTREEHKQFIKQQRLKASADKRHENKRKKCLKSILS